MYIVVVITPGPAYNEIIYGKILLLLFFKNIIFIPRINKKAPAISLKINIAILKMLNSRFAINENKIIIRKDIRRYFFAISNLFF